MPNKPKIAVKETDPEQREIDMRKAILKRLPFLSSCKTIKNSSHGYFKIDDLVIKIKDGSDYMQCATKDGIRLRIPYTWLTHDVIEVAKKMLNKEQAKIYGL